VDSNIATAVSSPDGQIVFFTGLLACCKNDSHIAAVLSHEIGHLVGKHSQETMSAFWFWFQQRANTRHTQQMELEADVIGMMLLARACYDPQSAPALMRNLKEKLVGDQIEQKYHIHPPFSERIENFRNWMPQAQEERRRFCLVDD